MQNFSGAMNLRRCKTFLLTLILFSFAGIPVRAMDVPRKILALYKGSENRSEEQTEIYNLAQLPLNNLGLVVEYADAEKGLPGVEKLRQYRGILTWFVSNQMVHAHRYRKWLANVILNLKLPVIIFGSFGAYSEYRQPITTTDRKEMEVILEALGLASSLRIWNGDQIKIIVKDTAYFDYEAPLQEDLIHSITDIVSRSEENKVLLRLALNGLQNDAAVLMPNGAYLQNQVIFQQIDRIGHNQWFCNPFKIFSLVFRCQDTPRLDLNILGGKRVAFLHIDGDGFSTISRIDRWHLCAQLMESRILTKYPLPYSVSVIAAEIDSNYIGNEEILRSARTIFELPNVEAASHGFAHPFDWRKGILELDSIPHYHFDPEMEIIGSTRFIQQTLLPRGKMLKLFFWSGKSNPTADHLRMVNDHNYLQINGGAGKVDLECPSISSFAPPYAQTGDQFRINARISNEYEFTNLWTGPYDGFKQEIQSLLFTAIPPRIVPADIYFHFYSMERNESWRALEQVVRFAYHQDWSTIYTSQYVRMVNNFFTTTIEKVKENEYRIHSNGFARTIRFPGEKRPINLTRSFNVLGYTHQMNDLIVHLNDQNDHRIVLGNSDEKQPYLEWFNRMVDELFIKEDTLRMKVFGYGTFKALLCNMIPGQFYQGTIFTNFSAGQYHEIDLTNLNENNPFHRSNFFATSDDDGRLYLELLVKNGTAIELYPGSSTEAFLTRCRYFFLLFGIGLFLSISMRRLRRWDTHPRGREYE